MGRWERIKPTCEVTDCVNCDDGMCGILDRTDFKGECRFYRARKQAPVTVIPEEKKEERPREYVAAQKYRIENMWRKKDE